MLIPSQRNQGERERDEGVAKKLRGELKKSNSAKERDEKEEEVEGQKNGKERKKFSRYF